MFDGSSSTAFGVVNGTSNKFVNIVFPSGISVSSSVKVYATFRTGMVWSINGSTVTSSGVSHPNTGVQTLGFTSGTMNSLRCQVANGNALEIYYIEVDGIILKDPISLFGSPSATGLNPFTDDINTIRGQASGYCTLNPLDALSQTLRDGNLTSYGNANTAGVTGTISVSSGKYYYEMTAGSGTDIAGIWTTSRITGFPGSTSDSYGYFGDGQSLNSGSGYTYASSYTSGDIIGVALDLDNGTLRFYKNGMDQGIAFSNISGEYRPAIRSGRTDTASTVNVNFGQKPFKFPPPDGFQPLNLSTVRPEKVIARPDQYVKPVLYSGTGSDQDIDLGLNADFLWFKNRGGDRNVLIDTVRGDDGTRMYCLVSELTTDEATRTESTTAVVKSSSWPNNGIRVGTNGQTNGNGQNYLVWGWKAGGNKNTYNIDDVGYANASDVNMNAGALNSSAYNQSQNWTNLVTFNAGGWNGNGTAPFDNDPDNSDYGDTTRSGGGYATLDISSLTGSRVISVTSEQTEVTITHDGGTTTFTPPNTNRLTHTFAAVSNPTSIKFDGLNSNSQFVLVGVTVDGARLVNSNITPTNVPSIVPDGCSVGTKQGFSIIKWAGTAAQGTLPHGLTQDPDFIVIKGRDNSSGNWQIWHRQFGVGSSVNRVYFNTTGGQDVSNTNIFKPNPGTGTILLNSGDHYFNGAFDYIGYAWHDVPGLQKFGSYVGNTAEAPFVELGFRPAILWIKCVTQNWYWAGFDSQRPVYNPNDGRFIAFNSSGGESSGVHNNIDFLSNGFKIRSTSTNSEPTNLNGQTYIYCAWAEAPNINLYGAQANAR